MSLTHTRVLALDPTPSGFAFAVLEGEQFLVESEIAHVKRECAKERFEALVLRFQPDVLVMEDPENCRKGKPARQLIRRLTARAGGQGLAVTFVARAEVKEYFAPYGQNKYVIAEQIGRRFPQLLARVPPKRRSYQSEPERMAVFDAISFALTVFARDLTDDIEF